MSPRVDGEMSMRALLAILGAVGLLVVGFLAWVGVKVTDVDKRVAEIAATQNAIREEDADNQDGVAVLRELDERKSEIESVSDRLDTIDERLRQIEQRVGQIAVSVDAPDAGTPPVLTLQPIESVRGEIDTVANGVRQRIAQARRVLAKRYPAEPKPRYVTEAERSLVPAIARAEEVLAADLPSASTSSDRPALWQIRSRIRAQAERLRARVGDLQRAWQRARQDLDVGEPSVLPERLRPRRAP